MTTLIDEKTDKPEFKLTHGKDYVEKQVLIDYFIFIVVFNFRKLLHIQQKLLQQKIQN